MEGIVTLIVLAPLIASIIAGLVGRRIGNVASQSVTTGSLFLACGLSWYVFSQWTWGGLEPFTVTIAPFIHVGDFISNWSVRIDALSATMLVVVTTVSALVHLYSWGYMAEDDSKPRFFAYLSFFSFAMLALVTAADFMQLFFGWEGVGVASYLLIGFWFKKPTANAAAIKAFVVNRIGDFGFALGIMTVFWAFGSIEFAHIFPHVEHLSGKSWNFLGQDFRLMDLACALLFVGAMGKSAQFFLHTWLPDAMEGPTPVSALIHAATMVTAGVYMVCLLSPMFEFAPVAKDIVVIVGAVTALFAATVGLTQNDIKRVIAYSTCSQLGYMFFAAGVGAYQAAMFHLFTHAFFKALLFLGAGSVIHGMHHEQDMRRYGNLAKYLPVTYAVMTIGTIAITGLGIPGVFGFAGFYSKDTIIEAAFAWGQHSPVGIFAGLIGILVAGLTAFYSWRVSFFTFNGRARWGEDHHEADLEPTSAHHDAHHDGHGHDHQHTPHESPWTMLVPIVLLAVGAAFAGFVFVGYFVGEGQAEFWRGAIFTSEHNHVLHEAHESPEWVKWTPLVASVLGLLAAAYMYLWKQGMGARLAAQKGLMYLISYNKWYFDEIYEATFVRATRWLGDVFWKVGDKKIIDGLGPDGVAATSAAVGKLTGKMQTGYVYHYAFVMLLGILGLLTFAFWAWS